MAVGLYLFKNMLDLAVGADDERCSGDAFYFLSIHYLLFHNIVANRDFPVCVRQQGEGQAFLVGKLSLRIGGIRGDAKQRGAGLLNLFI